MIDNIMNTDYGATLISIILGFGLAAMFRKVCKDGHCVIIKGPNLQEIQEHIYRIENNCYKYTPEVVNCNKK